MAWGTDAGYAINPARDFGPRLASFITGYGTAFRDQYGGLYFWVPIVAPLIGAVIGAWLYRVLVGGFLPDVDPRPEGTPSAELTLEGAADHSGAVSGQVLAESGQRRGTRRRPGIGGRQRPNRVTTARGGRQAAPGRGSPAPAAGADRWPRHRPRALRISERHARWQTS
jgi:hypothetical protein